MCSFTLLFDGFLFIDDVDEIDSIPRVLACFIYRPLLNYHQNSQDRKDWREKKRIFIPDLQIHSIPSLLNVSAPRGKLFGLKMCVINWFDFQELIIIIIIIRSHGMCDDTKRKRLSGAWKKIWSKPIVRRCQ